MIRKVLLLFVLLYVCAVANLYAINESVKITSYSYKDGLATSCVNSVFKDSRGFLWLCTINGLFRYDGYNFRNINSIVNGSFNYEALSIVEDTNKNLWIGTTSQGVIFYNTRLEQISQVDFNVKSNFRVNHILFTGTKMWLASNAGLISVANATNFKAGDVLHAEIYFPDPVHLNLQDNVINFLFCDQRNESIWVGTNGALYELATPEMKFYPVNSFPQNSIRFLTKYKNLILAGSWDGGIFCVDPLSRIPRFDSLVSYANSVVRDKRVKTVWYDDKNRLWIATFGNGLYIFSNSGRNTYDYVNYKNDIKLQDGIKSNFINQLLIDNTGTAWLSMNQTGLAKMYFQNSNVQYVNLPQTASDSEVKEILSACSTANKQKIWVSTNGNGLYLFDIQHNTFNHFNTQTTSTLQLQFNDISLCYQDRTGNLWIVYRKDGLYVVPSHYAMPLIQGNLKFPVKPINANMLFSYDSRFNSYITKFFEDSKGRIWIGLWGSLFLVKTKNEFSNATNTNDLKNSCSVICLYTDELKDKVSFPIYPVFSIHEINSKTFWLGTLGGGITELTETSETFFSGRLWDFNSKLPQLNVRSLYGNAQQGIWIGTSGGMCFFNAKTKKLKTITKADGLSSDDVCCIAGDGKSNIWISTSYGVSSILATNSAVQNYLNSDNDENNQYLINSGAAIPDGPVWFSTSGALVLFNPTIGNNETIRQPLYFTDIKLDNITVLPQVKYDGTCIIETNINSCKELFIPYNHSLTIEFAALDFGIPDRNRYKYRIDRRSEWLTLTSNQRSVILASMKPGTYAFEIKVASASGNESTRRVLITFLPPFWQTKTAFVIYFLLLLSAFLFYRRLTIQKIKQLSVIENERYEIKKLEELAKMKSEFFSNISHEFRTPLSLIINPLEKLLADNGMSAKNKERIGLILKSSNRLLKLTNEIMDFSKVEKNLLVPEFQNCEIVNFVAEIVQLFNNMADSMNIEYKFNSALNPADTIPIDKEMIEKVIFNLLSNAFKYTPVNGVVMVNISKYQRTDTDYIKISVINTGEGISSENQLKIFDRFYQVNNLQNHKIEGTGIGLALVKSFVELHKGKVEVESEPGVETCFDVLLPVNQKNVFWSNEDSLSTNSSTLDNNNLNSEARLNDKKSTSRYKLLLVEDDDDIRNYIVNELEPDFKIATAINGQEGIKIAGEIIPDLIITDVMMPVLSGIELCRQLKGHMSTSHIPIIILSAKTDTNQQIEGLEMGADVYMVKPFSIEHLKIQILRLISFKEKVYSRYLKETTLVPQGNLATKLDEEFINKIIAYIETNLTDVDLNVDQLCNCVHLSKVQTYRKVKAISGLSIVEFIRTIRLKKAAELVLEKRLNFAEIAFETGFSTPSYFSKCFHDHFGKTPSDFASDYGKN